VGDGRLGRHDDDDVPVVAEALVWGGATVPGWEVAHLALDDARIVPAAAGFGGTATISIRMTCVIRRRCRGGKSGVEGKMTPDDLHRMDEGPAVLNATESESR
jgi:hypothetical protein